MRWCGPTSTPRTPGLGTTSPVPPFSPPPYAPVPGEYATRRAPRQELPRHIPPSHQEPLTAWERVTSRPAAHRARPGPPQALARLPGTALTAAWRSTPEARALAA